MRTEEDCEIRTLLDKVGDKWTLAVAYQLREGSRRFMELRRGTPGISQRMLTATLRGLERDGMVRRTVFPTVPPRVDYELTPLGAELVERVAILVDWMRAHSADIVTARTAYDTVDQPAFAGHSSPLVTTAATGSDGG